ncbi:MAG: histidinol-phosphatase [Oscillospiraceae bacterium]|nr:histidinol-phosphatase [Oscillospiraceae bacterium]
MLANYHTHTYRCHHASGEDEAYVEAAIERGLRVLGFSDHCPWVYPDGYVSGTRMLPEELDGYFSSLLRLRERYRDDITIYIGFECEYIPELMEAQQRLLAPYPVDYCILGEHFTQREPLAPYTGFPSDDEAALARYVDLCIEAMESGAYAYLAHPDLFNFTGDPAAYDVQYSRLCRYLAAHGHPVEINLLGAVEGRHYPTPRFLELAREAGCCAVIGCDAHTPDRVGHPEGLSLCEGLAEKYGLEVLEFLPGLGPK